MSKNYYISGEWNVICDSCSKKIKSKDAKERWDGFIVCPNCFEYRHPQDYVKARQDKITVPFVRPRPVDAFRLLQPLQDTVSPTDTFDRSMLFNRELSDIVSTVDDFDKSIVYYRTFTDSDEVISLDTGSIFNEDYVLVDYVESYYVGTTRTFT